MANRCMLYAMVLVVALGLSWSPRVQAADENLRAELTQAQKEIQELRTELAQMKKTNTWQYQSQLQEMLKEAPPAAANQAGGVLALPAGWKFQPYGYVKFDMSYDDSAVVGNDGDYVLWVKSEDSTTRADDAFSATARQTRLGFKIFAPDIGDIKVMGRAEIDFYNPVTSSTNEYKSTPQMRHAYGEMTGPDWSILFGQTSDVISPLFPNTLNYTVGWFGGNPGYRHPQLRFTKWWECEAGGQLKLETALSRDINSNKGAGTIDDGQDTGVPTVLARVSCATPLGDKKMVAGISGHYGTEEVDWDYVGDDDVVHTWSLNLDLLIPVTDMVEVKGELFWAENFDSYFGGIGQGVNSTTQNEIAAIGGWAQVGIKPCPDWTVNSGMGFDNPSDGDLESGDKSHNMFVFTNVNYAFSSYLSTGIEVSYWQTDYKSSDMGDDFRIQNSWILKF